MIIVDLFIIIFVIGLLTIGAPIAVKKLWGMNPKNKALEAARDQDDLGETNTVKFNLTQLRHCHLCGKLTDPLQDLRTDGSWVHTDCYLKTIDQNKKGNA